MTSWYVVVKGKPYSGTLEENLSAEGLDFFIPVVTVEQFNEDRMVGKEKSVLHNIVFIRTDLPVTQVIEMIDGLRYPYYDHTTGKPAVVPDDDLQRFRRVLAMKSAGALFLEDPYTKFMHHRKVKVKAGEFEGMEGVVLRINRDRKVVISLGNMAVAVSGIHHSLLELI